MKSGYSGAGGNLSELLVQDREFPLTRADFDYLKNLAHELTGIVITDRKLDMLYSRLVRRIRSLGLNSFQSYCVLLRDGDGSEEAGFINAITTNLTSFFREGHHFQHLEQHVFPELREKNAASRRVRIWSAGCSTGEEPYSIAMTIMRSAFPPNWDVKLLATDLDTNVVAKAKSGVYGVDRIKGLSADNISRFFNKPEDESYAVKEDVKALITFKQLNLLEHWPMKGPFDVIFCRNVVIYFNKETQRRLFDRYADMLCDGGHLFIGHSESLTNVCDRFKLIGRTIYRKIR